MRVGGKNGGIDDLLRHIAVDNHRIRAGGKGILHHIGCEKIIGALKNQPSPAAVHIVQIENGSHRFPFFHMNGQHIVEIGRKKIVYRFSAGVSAYGSH